MATIKEWREVPIAELRPYEKNARRHKAGQVEKIAASIREFGFISPCLIDVEGNIIAGHGRILAAKSLGMLTVPCVYVEGLTDEQRRAYILADNKLTELAEWDYSAITEELKSLDDLGFDVALTGFDESFTQEDVVEDSFESSLPEAPNARLGDVFALGDHRVMCGSCVDLDAMSALLSGNLVRCVCTDPPYNMNYRGGGQGGKKILRKKIANDSMSSSEFRGFLTKAFTAMFEAMEDGAACYVFYKELGEGVFLQSLAAGGVSFRQELVWVKNQIVLGGGDYQNMYESCIYGYKGRRPAWYGGRRSRSVIESIDLMTIEDLKAAVRALTEGSPTDVIRENKPLKSDLHPTMKPIRLLAKLIQNSTRNGDAVLDMFGGSGSTLIACEQLGRVCYMMELDPCYVDVIVKRWEQFTGKKAELLSRTGG